MKKFALLLALLIPSLALSQTYPSPTFQSLTLVTPLTAANGGTGVANSNTITLGGNFTLSGANPLTITTTGSTSVTLPTSGTLLNTSTAASTYAPLASPVFTGTATIPAITGMTTPLSIAQGGTGASTAASALSSLGAAPIASPTFTGTVTIPSGASISGYATSGANSNITSLTGLSTPLSVSQGGTGSGTSTGSGGVVLATSPTITTPNNTGVTNGSNASAGSVGEFVSNSATSISLTTATPTNITSVSLTAGDWDVYGNILFTGSASIISTIFGGSNSTSATVGPFQTYFNYNGPVIAQFTGAIPMARYSLSTTTTIYLVGYSSFSSGSVTASGFIDARRVR